MSEHTPEKAQPGLTEAERDSIVCEIAGDYDNPGLWLAVEQVVRRREIEATANTLAVAGVLGWSSTHASRRPHLRRSGGRSPRDPRR